MELELSLAHLTMIHVSPPELIRIAGRCGYRYVGLRLIEVTGGDAWPLIGDAALLKETLAESRAAEVAVLDVELVRLCPDTRVADLLPMLETAAALGARHVLTQAHDPCWHRLVESYGAFCDLAAQFGMTADVEFLTWTDMRDVGHVVALIDAVTRDNAGIMIDTLHFNRSMCRPEDLDRIPAGRFHYFQIADAVGPAPHTKEGLIFTARQDRLPPGEGDIDLRNIIGHLPAGIPVAVEVPNERLAATMSDEERALAAAVATRELLAAL